MVRFFDQPIKTFLLVSGAIHIMLLGSLSLRYPFSNVSSRKQLISVHLLEIAPPQEKPIREADQGKKIQTTPSAKQEVKKLPEPRAELPPPSDQLRLPDSNSLTKPGGLDVGEGQGRNIALVPGRGISVGGERGAGRGEGSNPPNPGTGERGFRAAKPIQTAKASYPPMALRMGLEADVELKIQVDAEGKVTKVEIVKSADMGFEEEALKAVRQFRFEPARKDGEKISSEFTYIYRFRLEK